MYDAGVVVIVALCVTSFRADWQTARSLSEAGDFVEARVYPIEVAANATPRPVREVEGGQSAQPPAWVSRRSRTLRAPNCICANRRCRCQCQQGA